MRRARALAVLVVALLALGCSGSDRGQEYTTFDTTRPAGGSAARDTADQPLGELQPLTPADVELYLKVMREAAGRLRNLSEADREALQTWRDMNQGVPRARVPTPEEVIALQRAGELTALDVTVAREKGVEQRFSSISARVDRFLAPEAEAGEDEPLSPQDRARLAEHLRHLRELERADAGLLQPQRAEIVTLRRQVRIALPPVDEPE